MPCMITGASDGMAPAWLATSSAPPSVGMFSRPSHSTRNQLLVDRVVEPAGQLPHVLAAAPLVDVALPRVGDRLLFVSGQGRDRHEGTDPPCLSRSLCHGPDATALSASGHPLSQKRRSLRVFCLWQVSQRWSRFCVAGLAALGVGDGVVHLEAGPVGAAGGGAAEPVADAEGVAQLEGDVAAESFDLGDLGALHDRGDEEGVVEDLPHRGHRDRSEAGDVGPVGAGAVAADEGVEVDHHVDLRRRLHPGAAGCRCGWCGRSGPWP